MGKGIEAQRPNSGPGKRGSSGGRDPELEAGVTVPSPQDHSGLSGEEAAWDSGFRSYSTAVGQPAGPGEKKGSGQACSSCDEKTVLSKPRTVERIKARGLKGNPLQLT